MAVFGVSMFKNEGDIAYYSLMHMGEEGLDGIIVADNMSTDNTRAEIERARQDLHGMCEITILDDLDPAYFQSRKMSHLARLAAEQGAEWVLPFDADELWLAPDRVGTWLANSTDGVVTADLYNHFPSSIDPPETNPFKAIVWRQRDKGALPKVAFRWQPEAAIAQGNHAVSGVTGTTNGGLMIRHFPYRSETQFLAKVKAGAAAYAATNLPATEGGHWRSYGQILEQHGEAALLEVYKRWFWFLSPVDGGLVLDPAPFRRWR